jgi:PhnB protein
MPTTSRIPPGEGAPTPYLIVNRAAAAIAFYQKVFDATETMRFETAGKVSHAELKIGTGSIMLAGENESVEAYSPLKLGGSPISLMLYVEDPDAVFDRAIASGATVIRPVRDETHGTRMGGFTDPFGHKWWVACRLEELSVAEIEERLNQQPSH